MRIGIIAGEASGDILGAGLMSALRQYFPDAQFEGVGGERMIAQGFDSLYDQERLAVMGLIEPLKRLPELLSMRKALVQHFLSTPPDVFIGIDSPDFNLTIEERLKAHGIATVHYVSPSVWAWRQKRIVKIQRSVNLMLTLLPFEAAFYEQHQVPVCFVGHPLADDIPMEPNQQKARSHLGLPKDVTIVALMPGSRGGEVKLIGPVLWAAAEKVKRKYPDIMFVVPAANNARRKQIEQQLIHLSDLPLRLIDGQSHQVMEASNMVVMASGTTTLEAMLLKRPMIVVYRFARLSYAILSRLVKTRFFALPNLLANRMLVPELLQEAASADNVAAELLALLDSPTDTQTLSEEFQRLHASIRCDASATAAAAIVKQFGLNTKQVN